MIFNWSLIKTDLYIWQKIQELRQELLQLKVIDKQALNGKTGFLSRWTRGSQLELELIQAGCCKKKSVRNWTWKTRESIGGSSVSIPHSFQHLRSKHRHRKGWKTRIEHRRIKLQHLNSMVIGNQTTYVHLWTIDPIKGDYRVFTISRVTHKKEVWTTGR